jgi:hypothetical protein
MPPYPPLSQGMAKQRNEYPSDRKVAVPAGEFPRTQMEYGPRNYDATALSMVATIDGLAHGFVGAYTDDV